MPGSMVYRLQVAAPGAAHMTAFMNAMTAAEALRDNRGYNHIAGFHGAPDWYCWHHQFSRKTPLQARLFLPWHRAYLWWLEQSPAGPRRGRRSAVVGLDANAVDPGRPTSLPRSARSRIPSTRRRCAFRPPTPPLNRRTRRTPGANSVRDAPDRCADRRPARGQRLGVVLGPSSRTTTTRCTAGWAATWATSRPRRRTTRSSSPTTA